ncbi:MAG: hypothetical protein K2W97_06280 [Chthoniobacterales bacterium]|nr:hypothetical protein [Chthoniobacterales bacterium]
MPSPISSKPLTLGDFQRFSEQSTASDTAIVGKKFLGSGLKTISSLSFQRALGGTSSIVADFKTALSQKYGKEIADFVFSSENERAALSQGLNKKTITAVLEKAETINSSSLRDDFFSYQAAICSKQQTIKSQIQQLTGSSRASAQKKYSEIQNAWRDCADLFDTWNSNNSETTSKTLTAYFKEKLATIDRLSRDIIPDTAEKILEKELHLTPEESRKSITSVRESLGAPLANEMLRHLPEHTKLTKMLKELVEEIADKATNQSESSSHAITPAEEEESALDSAWKDVPDSPEVMALHEAVNSQSEEHPHVKKFLDVLLVLPELLETKVAELSPTLQPFTTSSKELPPKSTFYVNQEGGTCVRGPEDQQGPQRSLEQQQAAAKLFFSSLEDCFGTELIATIVPPEQQEQPLTIEKTQEVFGKIRKTLQDINEFLKTNPLLITPEYIIGLATHPEAAIAARENHEQLAAEGNTWLRTVQEAGLCGMLLSGSKIGLALAGVCTPTLPCVALALGAATVDGYIMGRFIARESGASSNTQQEAGALGATSTVGSAAGLILQRVAQGAIGAYVPEIISSSVAEYGGSYVAMSLRNAALGGARTAELQYGSDHQQHSMSAEDVISLEPRLARLFGIELPSLSQLITAVLNIPGALGSASSSTVLPSATSSSSTTVHES